MQVVYVCKEGYSFARYGLAACDLDLSQPGTHEITFWIVDSIARQRISVTRILRVVAPCTGSEVSCADGQCSIDGICVAGTVQAKAEPPAAAPTLALLEINEQASISEVAVPYGWSYVACRPGAIVTLASPCEPGATSEGRLLSCARWHAGMQACPWWLAASASDVCKVCALAMASTVNVE